MRRSYRSRLAGVPRLALASILPVALASPAIAQERIPAATGSSTRLAFQTQGLPFDSFRIFPTVRLSASYDDNVLIDDTARRGDAIITLAPDVRAVSQWARHSLVVDGYARVNRYLERDSLNNEEFGFGTTGRLDVQRTFNITGSASYDHLFELRGTPGDLAGVSQFIRYDSAQLAIGASKQINRVQLSAGGSISSFRFASTLGSGNFVDQRFRNRDVSGINGRISYQYSAVTSFFVSGSANQTDYLRRDVTGIDRSSKGYSALGGVRFEVTRLLSGEAGVGYLRQDFDDPRYTPFSGVNYNLRLSYQPTLLTGFTLVADRRLTDSALRQAGGVLASRIIATGEHELQRNVIVSANLGYTRFSYRGLDRVDDRWTAGVGARYQLNRYLSAAASYAYLSQSLDAFNGRAFDSNRFSLSLIASR